MSSTEPRIRVASLEGGSPVSGRDIARFFAAQLFHLVSLVTEVFSRGCAADGSGRWIAFFRQSTGQATSVSKLFREKKNQRERKQCGQRFQ